MQSSERHPAHALWCDPADGLVGRIARMLAERGLHAARTVVLVPYAQLMQVARAMWAACGTPGFAPRFETTRNWARSAGGFVPAVDDIAFDMARDLLTAQSLLSRALRHRASRWRAGWSRSRCSSRRWPRPNIRTNARPGPSACEAPSMPAGARSGSTSRAR